MLGEGEEHLSSGTFKKHTLSTIYYSPSLSTTNSYPDIISWYLITPITTSNYHTSGILLPDLAKF